jgi:hypothetical protein
MSKFFPEGRLESLREKIEEREIEKLKRISRECIENLKREGVPIDEDWRIKMEAFEGICKDYTKEKIAKDKEEVKEKEKIFEKEKIERYGLASEEKLKATGEKLEYLKNIIFYKFLREDFIICRSSRYDDLKNGVDNLILEKETGNLVCALDECEIKRYRTKEEMVWQKNLEGGGRLKYGLTVKEGKIKLGSQENLPVFLLFLKDNLIKEGIEKLPESLSKISKNDQLLFEAFKKEIEAQIAKLKLADKSLNPKLKEKLYRFEKVISEK